MNMEDNQNLEENTYSSDEVEKIVIETIEGLLVGVQYEEPKV